MAGKHSRRETPQDLPRLLRIEVGRVLAHPSDERVRGGLGDRVDARDVAGDGYKYLSRLVMEAGRCRAVDPLLRRSRHPAGPISGRN